MPKQTIKQAVHLARSGKSKGLRRAAYYLEGCPEGGWPNTMQAMMQIREELPHTTDRDYSLDDFVSATYVIDGAKRYRSTIEYAYCPLCGTNHEPGNGPAGYSCESSR